MTMPDYELVPPRPGGVAPEPSLVTLEHVRVAGAEGWEQIQVLPCGCVIGIEVKKGGNRDNPDDCGFGIVPHATGCKYYLYVERRTAERRLPSTMKWRP